MKKLSLTIAALALALSITGCSMIQGLIGGDFDAGLYVSGRIDVLYLGEASDAYYDILEDGGKDYTKELYESNMQMQFDYLTYYYFDIYTEYLSDEMLDRGLQVVKDIYAQSNYSVDSVTKANDGSFNVNVTVAPITTVEDFYNTYFEDICNKYYDKYYDEFSEEMTEDDPLIYESEEYFADLIFTRLEDMLENGEMSFGTPEVVVVRVYVDDDDLYVISDTDISSIDRVIMTYPTY